jgi:hypothetical protein
VKVSAGEKMHDTRFLRVQKDYSPGIQPVYRTCMKDEKRHISMPPLRQYEMPDTMATSLDIPPEKDTFVVPGERISGDELRSLARPVEMPPLHPSEQPDSMLRAITVTPDPRLDDPEWGVAKRVPDIAIRKGKLLHPWDD